MKKQIDAFDRAKRDFRIIAIIDVLFIGFMLLAIAQMSWFQAKVAMVQLGITTVITIVLFVTAHLFKKRSPKAVPLGYIIVSVMLITAILNVMQSEGPITSAVIPLILPLILFSDVIRAQKQTKSAPVPIQTPPMQQF